MPFNSAHMVESGGTQLPKRKLGHTWKGAVRQVAVKRTPGKLRKQLNAISCNDFGHSRRLGPAANHSDPDTVVFDPAGLARRTYSCVQSQIVSHLQEM
jgi:hypothetical protein